MQILLIRPLYRQNNVRRGTKNFQLYRRRKMKKPPKQSKKVFCCTAVISILYRAKINTQFNAKIISKTVHARFFTADQFNALEYR